MLKDKIEKCEKSSKGSKFDRMVKLSIITVCLNSVKTIERCIQSVIGQKDVDVEYIIIDGGSKDGTVEIIKKYERHIDYWISEPDSGIYDAMNKGIRKATGDVIALLNSDDWYTEDVLTYVAGEFNRSETEILFANVYYVKEGEIIKTFPVTQNELDNLWKGMCVYHPATFITRDLYKRVGLFDIKYKIAADYDWILRALNEKPIMKCSERVTTFFSLSGISDVCVKETLDEAERIALHYTENENKKKYLKKHYRERRRMEIFKRKLEDGSMECFKIKELFYEKKQLIYVFGAGKLGAECNRLLKINGIEIAGYIDNAVEKQGTMYGSYMVYSPDILDFVRFSSMIVISAFEEEVEIQLRETGISSEQYVKYSKLKNIVMEDIEPEIVRPKVIHSTYLKKYILYGAGKRCKALCDIIKRSNIHIQAIVDNNPELWESEFEGYTIKSPLVIKHNPDAILCITVVNEEVKQEIRDTVIQNNYCNKEISYNEFIIDAYKYNDEIDEIMQQTCVDKDGEVNILFDAYAGLGLGGLESWTISICKTLVEEYGKKIYIITKKGDYDVPIELNRRILQVDMDLNERFCEKNVFNLVEIITQKLPCKVVTCTTNEVMLAAYLVKLKYPKLVKIVSVIHNSHDNVYKENMEFKECPDIYVGVSSDIVHNLEKQGIPLERLNLMYIPFMCEQVLHRKYTLDTSKPICIGYAGRVELEQKRLDLLLLAVNELIERKINFRLEIAGEGSYLQHMKEYIADHSWEQYVSFCGHLDRGQIIDFWKRQDICINTSDYEGRSISTTEAMGAGVVPVVTAVSGTSDDIIDHVNGYLVNIGDFMSLVDKVEHLYINRNLLEKMGEKAHASVYPKSLMKPHAEFWNKLLSN